MAKSERDEILEFYENMTPGKIHIMARRIHPYLKALQLISPEQNTLQLALGLDQRTISAYCLGRKKLPKKHLPALRSLLEDFVAKTERDLPRRREYGDTMIRHMHSTDEFESVDKQVQDRLSEIGIAMTSGQEDLRLEYAKLVLENIKD